MGLPLGNEYNNWTCEELKIDWEDVEKVCKTFDEEDVRSYMKRITKRFEIYRAVHSEGYGANKITCNCKMWV